MCDPWEEEGGGQYLPGLPFLWLISPLHFLFYCSLPRQAFYFSILIILFCLPVLFGMPVSPYVLMNILPYTPTHTPHTHPSPHAYPVLSWSPPTHTFMITIVGDGELGRGQDGAVSILWEMSVVGHGTFLSHSLILPLPQLILWHFQWLGWVNSETKKKTRQKNILYTLFSLPETGQEEDRAWVFFPTNFSYTYYSCGVLPSLLLPCVPSLPFPRY